MPMSNQVQIIKLPIDGVQFEIAIVPDSLHNIRVHRIPDCLIEYLLPSEILGEHYPDNSVRYLISKDIRYLISKEMNTYGSHYIKALNHLNKMKSLL